MRKILVRFFFTSLGIQIILQFFKIIYPNLDDTLMDDK